MTCDKCGDIHTAQKEGKTQDECLCSCHKDNPLVNPPNPYPTYIPWYPYPYYQPCTPCCIPCCPCTDPNNAGKPMCLVCNCPCHGHMFTTGTGTVAPTYTGTTFCCTVNGTQESPAPTTERCY